MKCLSSVPGLKASVFCNARTVKKKTKAKLKIISKVKYF